MSRFAKINPSTGLIHKPSSKGNHAYCNPAREVVRAEPIEVWEAENQNFCKICFRNLKEVAQARNQYGKETA